MAPNPTETGATATCAFHPDRPAVDACARREEPICAECRTMVAGKPVCRRCVEEVRQEVLREQETAPQGRMYVPPIAATSSNTEQQDNGAFPQMQRVATATAAGPVSPLQLLAGIGLGLAAGLISTIAWVALVAAIKWNFSLFAVGVGWLIGFAVVKGTGRGGVAPAVVGGVLSLLFVGVGSWLTRSAGDAGIIFGLGFFELFCIGFAVYEGVIIPLRAQPQ